jgi:hypothetical protein
MVRHLPDADGRPVPMIATTNIDKGIACLLVGGWRGKIIVELAPTVSPNDPRPRD